MLLDVQLPDLDGFDLAAQLTAGSDPPAIVMTSSRDGSDFVGLVTRERRPRVLHLRGLRGALPYAFLVQMLVSFPDGQLHTRLERAVVAATWFDVTIMQWAQRPFARYPRMSRCDGCPANPWLISDNKALVDALANLQSLFAIMIVAGLIVALVRRSRALAPTQRRQLNPVIWTGAIALVVLTAALTARFAGVSAPVYYAGLFPLAAVPYAFLYGLMQSRLTTAGAVSELVARLSAAP